MRIIEISDALRSLAPEAIWSYEDEDYSTLEWLSPEIKVPRTDEIEAEIARLQAIEEANEYRQLRAAEYPDFREYLDGLVKGDELQMQSYIEACLAVKAKYPKPLER